MEHIDSIAIGGFDGMHKGHQELFSRLGKNGAIIAIETGYANLTPKKHRQGYTHYPIIYLELSQIKELDGLGFIEFLKQKFKNLKNIIVGYDFRFGKDRVYDTSHLHKFWSGEVIVVDEVCEGSEAIHSREIRGFISGGNIKKANLFLGHNYVIEGSKVDGQGLGQKELYATINIKADGFLLPKEGVYATLTRIDDNEHFYPSVSFIGHRVSTDGSFAIESHIIDAKVECKKYSKISFVSFLRDNQKFNSLDELKSAISIDIANAKKDLRLLVL